MRNSFFFLILHPQYNWTAGNTKGAVLLLNEVTTSTGYSSTDLVVRPNTLEPGFEYIFSLNVSQPATGLWGLASIALTPEQPPEAGNCTLSPEDSVQLLQNVVSFNCSGTALCCRLEGIQVLFWGKSHLKCFIHVIY